MASTKHSGLAHGGPHSRGKESRIDEPPFLASDLTLANSRPEAGDKAHRDRGDSIAIRASEESVRLVQLIRLERSRGSSEVVLGTCAAHPQSQIERDTRAVLDSVAHKLQGTFHIFWREKPQVRGGPAEVELLASWSQPPASRNRPTYPD
jgi:hypothetical protein